MSTDDSGPSPDSGLGVAADGSIFGPDGSILGPDGSVADAGDPLMLPLSDFCDGMGTVVTVGGGGECAGEIAEEVFRFGVCACETVTAQSQLKIDAFDSDVGPYGGANILEDGHLGVNGQLTMDGKLTIQGSAFVGGGGFAVGASSLVSKNVFATGDAVQSNASTDIGRNVFIDGDVVGRFNISGNLTVPTTAAISQQTRDRLGGQLLRSAIPGLRPCPCQSDEILDVGALTAWGQSNNDNALLDTLAADTWANRQGPNNIRLPCGRYYLDSIRHPGTLTVTAEGRTVLFVNGDMIIEGGLTLALEPGAEIDLFISGNLAVQAAAVLGTQTAPSKVRTYIGGTQTIDINASSLFGGNLYAPRADIIFGASANLYGAVFGKNISFSGSAQVHFDSAVRRAGDPCDEPDPANPSDGGPGDAGNPTDDGGTVDAGPVGCMSCGECAAPTGCVLAPGESSGFCGACQSDLDCCAPLSCIAGACILDV
jgi:hypothetical protein